MLPPPAACSNPPPRVSEPAALNGRRVDRYGHEAGRGVTVPVDATDCPAGERVLRFVEHERAFIDGAEAPTVRRQPVQVDKQPTESALTGGEHRVVHELYMHVGGLHATVVPEPLR